MDEYKTQLGNAPLSGLRIVEVAEEVSGPYCARLLADAGADVIKVEPPEGDPSRQEGPFPNDLAHPEHSGLFHYLNASKRGVVLDLTRMPGRRALLGLVQDADVVITNYPPEKLRALGLTHRRFRGANPRLIFTAITPFGFRSPYAGWKTNEYIRWNMGGFGFGTPGLPDYAEDPETEPPLHPQAPSGDIVAGGAAAMATLCALHSRAASGRGSMVDIPAQAALAMFTIADVMPYSYGRIMRGRHRVAHTAVPNALFHCKDGWVVIAAAAAAHWQGFLEAMGNPPWTESELFMDNEGRSAHWDALWPLIQEWTLSLTGEEITRRCQAKGVPCLHYHSISQVVQSSHLKERGAFRQLDIDGRSALAPGVPTRLRGMPPLVNQRGPRLGEHNQELLPSSASHRLSKPTEQPRGEPTRPRLPLEGVRVVDLGQYIAMPYGAQLLAWMGADDILVESRQRPRLRAGSSSDPAALAIFNLLHTNKRSITIDLKHPEGVALIKELVRISDVVVDNFSTGVVERLGLGYDDLRQVRPDIIMLSLGAFGRSGPMKDLVGLHSAVNLFCGVAAATGYSDGRPRILGNMMPDPWTGAHAFLAILMALYHRERTGQGQYIDQSMAEAFMQLVPNVFLDFTLNGREPQFMGNRDPVRAPQGVYRCRGWDAWVAISVTSDPEWRALCSVIGRAELAEDPRFATAEQRRGHHDEMDALIGEWSRRLTSREAARLLQAAGVPAGPTLNTMELLNEPHLKARRTVAYVDHPEVGRRRIVGIPWRIGGVPPVRYRHTPSKGHDNGHVLQEVLGLSEAEIRRLEAAGALS